MVFVFGMRMNKVIKISIIFLIGFLSANLVNLYFVSGFERPFSFDYFGFSSLDAPFDWIDEGQIKIYSDKVVIDVADVSISRYADTGSMLPVFGAGANGLRIVPKNEEEIHIGDIISFREKNYLIVHRVVDKGVDSQGVYFITKGDNNDVSDGKVRFDDIKYKTIGVIW
jgi:hypothetical protein